jgi:hypothetical protein
VILFQILAFGRIASGQEHDHDHLHFSHPLVTESPSPDTKLRFDFLTSRTTDAGSDRQSLVQMEGEYAFNHSVSLAIIAPYVWIRSNGTTLSNLGNVELSLKAASMRFAESGILIGGGLSTALPTGSEEKGTGSGHIVEIEPFIDAAYKHDALELVTFLSTASALNRRNGEQAERTLSFHGSALYALVPRVEALLELATSRPMIGPATGPWETLVAPGVKIYPVPNRQIMFGASLGLGTGAIRSFRQVLASAFYHF